MRWPHFCLFGSFSSGANRGLFIQTGLDPTAAYGAEVMSSPDPFNRGSLLGSSDVWPRGEEAGRAVGCWLVCMKNLSRLAVRGSSCTSGARIEYRNRVTPLASSRVQQAWWLHLGLICMF
jgi:hypothetical protein